jgi:hypothetical protein
MDNLLKEKAINFVSIFVFLIFFIASVFLFELRDLSIVDISIFDTILLILATYRISRMIVYEKVFSYFRYLVRIRSGNSIINSINNLITCPWCTSVWMGLLLFDLFYMVPYGRYFVYIMVISSIASPLILLCNYLSLQNDILKKRRDE